MECFRQRPYQYLLLHETMAGVAIIEINKSVTENRLVNMLRTAGILKHFVVGTVAGGVQEGMSTSESREARFMMLFLF